MQAGALPASQTPQSFTLTFDPTYLSGADVQVINATNVVTTPTGSGSMLVQFTPSAEASASMQVSFAVSPNAPEHTRIPVSLVDNSNASNISESRIVILADDAGRHIGGNNIVAWDATGTYGVNLTTETMVLPYDFTVGMYRMTVPGRNARWVNASRRPLNARNLAALLNRGGVLEISSEAFHRNGPGDSTNVIAFPLINPRPRAERLRPWFGEDTWTLRARATRENSLTNVPAAPIAAMEFVNATTTNNRLQASSQWRAVPADGFGIPSHRETYFFRNAPLSPFGNDGTAANYTPASRPFRVRPATMRRPLNLRINYANETIRTRVGQEFSLDGGITWTAIPTNADGRAIPFNVSGIINDGNILRIRTATTGRRARSADQAIIPLPRAIVDMPLELPVTNGRIDAQALRPYSAFIGVAGAERWRAIPRITGETTFTVRHNSTARVSRGTWSGYAASANGTLHITWGVVGQDSRNRDIIGVTRAVITTYGANLPPLPISIDGAQFSTPPTTTPDALYYGR